MEAKNCKCPLCHVYVLHVCMVHVIYEYTLSSPILFSISFLHLCLPPLEFFLSLCRFFRFPFTLSDRLLLLFPHPHNLTVYVQRNEILGNSKSKIQIKDLLQTKYRDTYNIHCVLLSLICPPTIIYQSCSNKSFKKFKLHFNLSSSS